MEKFFDPARSVVIDSPYGLQLFNMFADSGVALALHCGYETGSNSCTVYKGKWLVITIVERLGIPH
jgi:hypothetical protein